MLGDSNGWKGSGVTGGGGVNWYCATWPNAGAQTTFGLASLIIEDRAAAANRGEAPVLDGDPFTGSQNWDISNLAIDVTDTGAFKAIGTVTFMNSGKPQQVVLELLRSGNNWRIADVTWESGTLRALYRRHAARDSESVPR